MLTAMKHRRDRTVASQTGKQGGVVVVETITIPSAIEGVKIASSRGSAAECTARYDTLLGEDVRAYGDYIIDKRLSRGA